MTKTKMKKPAGVIVLLVLNYIRLGLIVLGSLLTVGMYMMPEDNPYRRGFFATYATETLDVF